MFYFTVTEIPVEMNREISTFTSSNELRSLSTFQIALPCQDPSVDSARVLGKGVPLPKIKKTPKFNYNLQLAEPPSKYHELSHEPRIHLDKVSWNDRATEASLFHPEEHQAAFARHDAISELLSPLCGSISASRSNLRHRFGLAIVFDVNSHYVVVDRPVTIASFESTMIYPYVGRGN